MPDPTPVRVLIADDHPIFRMGLRRLLDTEPGFEVIGEASDGQQAVTLVRSLQPDLLLLDVAMPVTNGLEVLRQLGAETSRLRTVLLTASIDPSDTQLALRLGASGVLLKTSATDLIFKCMRSVMEGQYWFGRDALRSLVDAVLRSEQVQPAANTRPFGLTARELEVVALVATGASNRDIAHHLNLSEETVKHHLSKIFDKTGQSSRVELALFAVQLGLLPRQ